MSNQRNIATGSRTTMNVVGQFWGCVLNPVRGCLIIVRRHCREHFPFVFRRHEMRSNWKLQVVSRTVRHLETVKPVPPKNKRKVRWFGEHFHKQATPNGVSARISRRPKTFLPLFLVAFAMFSTIASFAEDYDPARFE